MPIKILITVMVVIFSCQPQALEVNTNNPLLHYSGRWDHSDLYAPTISWPASSVSIRLKAKKIQARISTTAEEQFRVIIDGKPAVTPITITANQQQYLLADNLDDSKPTTIQLFKETSSDGVTTFNGFDISKGKLYSIEHKPKQKLLFLGDSNMNGTSLYSEKDSGNMGSYYAYPATVARMLGAQYQVLANGGATLTGNNGNSVLSFIDAKHLGQEDVLAHEWFQPDLIVVNAGANDVSKINSSEELLNRYKLVINKLRQHYGNSPHVVLHNAYGWHTEEPANNLYQLDYESIDKLSFSFFPWMWEQWHGSMVEHAGQARLLAAHIESLNIGFTIKHQPQHFDGFGRNFNVANGSFEHSAKSNFKSFGWRYHEDGVERINDQQQSYDGQFFIRLKKGKKVHQGTDATGDFLPGGTKKLQSYKITAMIKSNSKNAIAEIGADFEGQALYQRRHYQGITFQPTNDWQQYTATVTAPIGTWKTYISLKSQQGTIDFDQVHMQGL